VCPLDVSIEPTTHANFDNTFGPALIVKNGAATDVFFFNPLNPAVDFTGKPFYVADDHAGGSIVSLRPSLTPVSLPDIFWQSANGQASIWEMDGSSLVGGGPVSPNPGPNWTEIGTGDFNHDGHSHPLRAGRRFLDRLRKLRRDEGRKGKASARRVRRDGLRDGTLDDTRHTGTRL
jgi:hypothetical protein